MLPIDELIKKANETTATTLDLLIPEIWGPRIEANLRKQAVFQRTAVEITALEGSPGDTVHVPTLADIAEADALTDGTDMTNTALGTPVMIDFGASEYGKAVMLTEKMLNRVNYDMISWVVDALQYSMTLKLENTFAGLYATFDDTAGNILRPNDRASVDNIVAGDKLSAVVIRKAVQTMMERDMQPFEFGGYYMFVSPKQWTDLFSDTTIAAALQYGRPDDLFGGNLPEFHKVRFVPTNYVVSADNSGSVKYYQSMLVAPRWAGISWKTRPRIVRDPLKDFGRKYPLAVKADWEIKAFHTDRALVIQTA